MAIVLKDRVKETTNTTGTSDFVLAGAVGGFQAFSAIGNGNTTYYAAVDNTTGDWEIGYGQYSTTGPTLTRATILASSAAGAKISFTAGPKDVFVTYPAGKAIYEELSGNTLIDGGPLTVIGSGVTTYTTFSAALGELYANINSFAQFYAQNLNSGSEASADFVAYNDLGDGNTNFVDMGINSSNYSSATYPIFTPGSAYVFNDGAELFIGSATDDLVLFAGGVDTTDEAVRIDKTTKAVTTSADVNVGGALDVTGAATFGSTVLLNADPTLNLQAATKQYVDTAVSTGLHLHQPVRVATTGNLTATYNNGASGVGATLTNSGTQVALSIDGISLSVNNRVLVWQQTTQSQNGVYVVTTVGSGSTNWVLTRASDADTYAPQSDTGLGGGDYFYVQEGTTGSGDSYVCTNDGTITFGTTAITFAQFSGAITYTGGTNIDVTGQLISLTGTVAATNGGTGVNTVATGDLLYGSGTNTWSKLSAGAAYKSLVMNAGGTNVEWNAVALDQSGAVSGALPATNGGTGQTSYATGDILYSNTANALAKLSGNTTTTKKFLGQTGTGSASQAPVWEQPAASDITGLAPSATTDTTNAANITSGTLPAARLNGSYTGITGVGTLTAGAWNASTVGPTYGGTGLTSYAVGDLLYADTTTSLAKLADVATGNALISGGVGAAPSWGKVGLATHVSGTLPIANGGTNGSATPTAGAVPYGTGTAYAFNSAGTSGQLLTSAGTSAPTWTSQSSLSVGTATNLAGGGANQVPYQTGSGATSFVTAPTTAGTALTWNGSALVWQTAGSATLQNDTSTNSTYYPVFATATSGSFTDARVSSTKLTFNPNTGLLTTTGLSTSSLTMNGTLLFANATSPNTYTVQFGDNTGWNLRFMTNVSGTPTTRFTFGDNGNFTSVGKYIIGSFPNSTTNSGEAWLGRAADRSTGSMTVQLGGSTNASFFEVVDYAWTTVTLKVGMNDFTYKGSAVWNAGLSSVTTAGNASWGGRIQLGGNGGNSGSALISVVQATDGNLHLDCGVGKQTYINYYANGNIYLNGGTYYISSNGANYNGTAAAATYLNSSNYIQRTGSSSNLNTDFQNTPAGSTRIQGDDSGLSNSPGGSWWFYQNMRHSNSSNYWGTQVAWGWEDNAHRLATRNISANSFSGWIYYVNSNNLSSYTAARNGSGYLIPENWIQLNGSYGLYSGNNGAHFYPNDASYGSWRILGTRNGWAGLEFPAVSSGNVCLMMNSNDSGHYNTSYGWHMLWSGGTLYCFKNTYGGGTQATVLDSSNYAGYVATNSSNNTEQNFAIGTSVAVFVGTGNAGYATNSSITVYQIPSTLYSYSGSYPLSGTWRARGIWENLQGSTVYEKYQLFTRVA